MGRLACITLWAGLLCAAPAGATPLQVAVVLDRSSGLEGAIAELDAFESTLIAERPDVQMAVVSCERETRDQASQVVASGFGAHGLGEIWKGRLIGKGSLECPIGADLIVSAIDELEWSRDADRQIVVVGRLSPRGGGARQRVTLADAAHRAEHLGIALHALNVVSLSSLYFYADNFGPVEPHRADVTVFLDRPTEPMAGREINMRRATGVTGGSYSLVVVGSPRYWGGSLKGTKASASIDALRARAFGTLRDGRDALDELADGSRRPSQVAAAELPSALQRIDLEPLLDALWDFVDARRVFLGLVGDIDAIEQGAPLAVGARGSEVARRMLAPRRFMPSRR